MNQSILYTIYRKVLNFFRRKIIILQDILPQFFLYNILYIKEIHKIIYFIKYFIFFLQTNFTKIFLFFFS